MTARQAASIWPRRVSASVRFLFLRPLDIDSGSTPYVIGRTRIETSLEVSTAAASAANCWRVSAVYPAPIGTKVGVVAAVAVAGPSSPARRMAAGPTRRMALRTVGRWDRDGIDRLLVAGQWPTERRGRPGVVTDDT